MADITYHVVMAFVRNEEGEGELIAETPVQAPSASAATSKARALANTKAGVVAFSRCGDPATGDFADAIILFKSGEVPDDIIDYGG